MNDNTRITFLADAELWKKFKGFAILDGTTPSELFREYMENFINRREVKYVESKKNN